MEPGIRAIAHWLYNGSFQWECVQQRGETQCQLKNVIHHTWRGCSTVPANLQTADSNSHRICVVVRAGQMTYASQALKEANGLPLDGSLQKVIFWCCCLCPSLRPERVDTDSG